MNDAAAPDRSAAKAILTAAFVAGTLDILAAFALYALLGVPATRILQSIAAGLLGPAAFEGAARTAWLGLGLHFAIMTVAVGVYYLASRFLAMLRQRWIASGVIFGLAMFTFMTYIVLPLSANPPRGSDPWLLLIVAAIHVICVGLPIAFIVARYGPQR